MTTVSSLSREDRWHVVKAYDKAQRELDHAHGAALFVCRNAVRGEAANALLVELDRFADAVAVHRKTVGQLLDNLTEEQ